ncbi:MAG: amidohydrolase family protein [Pontimonas sp.]
MILRRATLFDQPERGQVDLLIRRGYIDQISPAGVIKGSEGVDEFDVDGRVLAPGLWDEHVHLGSWAEFRRRISLEAAHSAREAAELMAVGSRASQASAQTDVLIGAGFRDGLWPDNKTAALLDGFSGEQPWLLWSVDLHSVWLNTTAAQLLGYQWALPEGVLRERDAFGLAETLASTDGDRRDQWVSDALAAASARGVVGIVDFDFDDNHANWQRRRMGRDDWGTRVDYAVYPDYLEAAIARGDYTGKQVAPGVAVGFLKVITDGSLNTRTAHCCQPYRGIPGEEYGAMNYSVDELEALMSRGKRAGFSPAFHAIGDEANRVVLDLFDSVGVAGRIEHAQLLREVDFSRFAALAVTASVQPQHAVDDRDVADHYWGDRTDRVIAIKSLLDAGAHVVFGSDAPVSPLDPFAQIAAAVARTDDDRQSWVTAQRIGVRQALRASMRNDVAVGEPADLVVLGADPLWLERALEKDPARMARALRELPVWLTMVDGRVTYSAMDTATAP